MSLLLTLRVALRAMAKNKMRATLTVLGVVIGIAAVTAMVSIGQSATNLVQGQLESLGTNVIVVIPGSKSRQGVRQGLGALPSLTASDADAIARECPSVLASTPIVGAAGQLIYGNANWSPRDLVGVGVDHLRIRNWQLRSGGFFTDRDIHTANKVCVIGNTIVAKLFQTTNPLGKTIRIKDIPFVVIGVLEAKGADMVGEDQDNVVMLPYTTVKKRLWGSNFDNVHAILASARSADGTDEAAHEIRQLLMDRHRIAPGDAVDFEVKTITEISNMLGMVTGIMTALLASIAGISLLVGGVGIMNIMLVSVTERTREIGIRMAVGARSRDILCQFLVEAIVLSTIGGLIGLSLGVAASVGLTQLINALTKGTDWPMTISVWAAVVAVIFSAAVGLCFGFFPALRASRLDPIEALRYE